jgi:prepilin-type N-terminal cleavage/methylation domain-containing protein
MKKNTHNYIKLWFTMIELVITITIIAILWAYSYNFFESQKREQHIDDEISDVQQYWFLLASLVNKKGDILLDYCKNTSWNYDSNCFETDPLNDWNTDNICNGKTWDFNLDNDCDNWCVIIDCSNINCNWNNIYYDFSKLFTDNINYDYTIKTDTFIDKMSYRICPEKDSLDNVIVGKWIETEHWTFNPSFTLYYNWRPVYQYNSNP